MLERLDELVVKPTERVRRQGRLHRAARRDERARRRWPTCSRAYPERWIAQELVHLSTVPDRAADGAPGAAPRRPAPVRGLRRGHPDRPGRADARRAARGLDDRQLLAGRRLEGHLGARGRRATPTAPSPTATLHWSPPRDARPALRRRVGRPATAAAAAVADARPDRPRAVLARAQPRARRAHRAHARRRLPGRRCRAGPTTRAGVALDWGSMLAIMGAEPPGGGPARRDEVAARADARRRQPDVGRRPASPRAREGARTVRDVISAEMWEAINTIHLGLLRRDLARALQHRPVLGLRVRQGALRAVLGR